MSAMDSFQEFERFLDGHFARLETLDYDANAALALVSNIQEQAASSIETFGLASSMAHGITILAPYLVSGKLGPPPDIGTLLSDLSFCMHYYSLRELLYYSYNVPGAVEWAFEHESVQVRYTDPSLPRQFYTMWNEHLELSREMFADSTYVETARTLLRGEAEGQISPDVEAASLHIDQEVDQKLRAYFSILDPTSSADLGGYTYAEFQTVYRFMLGNALYHRRFGEANDQVGAIFIEYDELVNDLEMATGLTRSKIASVLDDIIFDDSKRAEKLDASYFSLMREGAGARRVVMRSVDFTTHEGLVNLLRVVAIRRPQLFLRNVGGELGVGFVARVKSAFETAGFRCLTEISLSKFDPQLPDIDLLVICEEPTLGYVLFVCELKGPIPPRWAKDQLKAIRQDGVSKAFRQSEAIQKFLRTPAGISAMKSWLPPDKPPRFESFVLVVEPLIVTSDNAGMFFGDENTPIANFRTIERLLKASDGDTAFIQHVIHTYNEEVDKIINRVVAKAEFAGIVVEYEGVADSPIMRFAQQSWRNSEERQAMIDAFLADGAHPFDTVDLDAKEMPPGTILIAFKSGS
ncbi:hypothetical protein [Mesorhizobium sp. M6A.T.Cr.TU.016.01.1.1]|uniref:hypothetical protein n=1 Tax=Mesorhizobium sp. M6A.T.Cr.TU.016.01.1.1 TaxID=2493677 RepID=UPI000F764AD5|nr:hypothetical protein [Mesorhizobium sp. M6A.T.Cr.TU.016.01.1.1]AZO67984.1 hypothetical protein EJ075_25740 [Mesorhizobium sp. M6A.T.Cr.TU.016.01.1.1]